MNDGNYVKEMDFKEMLFKLLYSWRKIIIVAIVLAVLCSGYKFLSSMPTYIGNADSENQETIYNNAISAYNTSKDILQNDIIKINDNIKRQTEYNENSIFMKINHFDEQVGNLSYFIDTDYQIIPDSVYQNDDKTDSVIKSYLSVSQNGDLYSYVADNLSYDLEITYLKELFTIWDDIDNRMIYIQMVHKDSEACDEIIQLVKEYYNQLQPQISSKIGEHKLTLINESHQQYIDLALNDVQKSKYQLVLDYKAALDEKVLALNNLQMPINSSNNITFFIKSIIKFAILGAVLGAFLAIVLMILNIMLGDKPSSLRDIKRTYNIKVLGCIKVDSKKRLFGFVDRWLHRLEGIMDTVKDENEEIKRICAILKLQSANFQNGTVMVTGTADVTTINEICKKMANELKDTCKLISGGNVSYTTNTIVNMVDCNSVILIEELGRATFTEITKEIENIVNLDKKIIGTILI